MPPIRLDWPGRDDLRPRPVPAALRVLHRFPGGGVPNHLVLGDNLAVLEAMRGELAGRVDLATIDPPYATGDARRGRAGTYTDSWGGMAGYLSMLEPRLHLLRDLLSPAGVLIVQADHRAHPYVRVLMDEVFGPGLLVNDAVWSYRSGGGTKRRFGAKHDNLVIFSRTENHHFNPDAVRVPYDAAIAKSRLHLFHPDGKVPGDVWDIPRPPNHSPEWTGWPTQKPLALLEFQVRAFTPPGGLVLDAFCGSGTAAVAAARLGRRWVAIDAEPAAIHAARKRLALEPDAWPFEILGSQAAPAGAAVTARLHPTAGGVEVELTGFDPGGLAAVDAWSVEVDGGDGEPFRHDWSAARFPRTKGFALRSPALAGKRFRVLAAAGAGCEGATGPLELRP